ncbi:hypothetical protein Ancab_017949 [Ancistrocladus abbreviatus]
MEDGDSPPYWQPPATITHYRRRSYSPLLNSSLSIILLPSLALLVIFVAIPSLASFISQTVKSNSHTHTTTSKPISVKRSWDSLNIVLVLFAIFCGIFARRNDDESSPEDREGLDTNTSVLQNNKTEVQGQLFEFSDIQRICAPRTIQLAAGVPRLRRSTTSYPDLRQEYLMWETAGNERLRFFDDFDLDRFYPLPSDHFHQRQKRTELDGEESSLREIPVDTFSVHSKRHSPSPLPIPPLCSSPPPPPPPPPQQPRRTYQTLPRKENIAKSKMPNPPPPPPPPPATPPNFEMLRNREEKKRRGDRKKNNATKEIANAFVSLYSQRKRKKKQKLENEASVESLPSQFIPPQSPPPPPPPPPPTVFHNIFKIASKSKKIHSVPAPPPPPPPSSSTQKSKGKKNPIFSPQTPSKPPISPISRRRARTSDGKPPPPVRGKNFYKRDDDLNSGGESPLIPAPPPPPPCRLPKMKFVVQGESVRMRSTHSSRCSSPEVEDVDEKASDEINGGDRNGTPASWPSPDVNVKADSFIARRHDEWRLEKLNSWRERHKVDPSPWVNGPKLGGM